jgi:hypothetical protein
MNGKQMVRFMIPALSFLLSAGCALRALENRENIEKEIPMKQVTWNIDNLESIGGHKTAIEGAPRVIESPGGKAVEFDGVDDAIFVEASPLAGAKAFTAEVVFCPYPGGMKEQRFFHMQENSSDNRIMFEIRLTDDNRWFLDTFIKMGEENHTLYAEESTHPVGPWYHAAIVVDGKEMRHYVNGVQELSQEIAFLPHGEGRTSIGVRINRVCWFKGAIRKARFTDRVLSPEEFMK